MLMSFSPSHTRIVPFSAMKDGHTSCQSYPIGKDGLVSPDGDVVCSVWCLTVPICSSYVEFIIHDIHGLEEDYYVKESHQESPRMRFSENGSHVRKGHGQLPTCMDGSEGHCVEFAPLDDRKVQELTYVCAQNAVVSPRLKHSLYQRYHVV
ncbi:hypothetical protein Trydic_g3405 [Trypoxylus dichotomus]